MNNPAGFACPFCQAVCQDPRAAAWIGKKIRCSRCGRVFVLDHLREETDLPTSPADARSPVSGRSPVLMAVGVAMALLAGLVILSNLAKTRQNERTIQEHPIITVLSDGANLKPAYTFAAPYSGFEILIMAVGLVGVGLIAYWVYRRRRGET